MRRTLGIVGGLALGLCLSQFPEYAQQYTQRLGGAVDELRIITSEFEVAAREAGLTLEQAIWRMAGGVRAGESYPGGKDTGLVWTIQNVGDFDGDGRSDILWRARDGQLAIWFRGDAAAAAYPSYRNVPGPVDLAWRIQGVRDFDADGRADILWRSDTGQ